MPRIPIREILDHLLERLRCRLSIFRVAVNGGEGQKVAHPNLVKNIGDHLVAGMKTYEFLISHCSLAVLFTKKVGVAQLQVGKNRVFAVRVVFFEVLEVLGRFSIVFFSINAVPERASCSAVLSIVVDFFFEKISLK